MGKSAAEYVSTFLIEFLLGLLPKPIDSIAKAGTKTLSTQLDFLLAQPRIQSELLEAARQAESDFRVQARKKMNNDELVQSIASFPVWNRELFQSTIRSLPDHMDEDLVAKDLQAYIRDDWKGKFTPDELRKGVAIYLNCLRLHLLKVNGFAELVTQLATLRIDERAASIQLGVEELLRRTEKKPQNTAKIQIVVEGSIRGFTASKKDEMIGILSEVLKIEKEQIRILRVTSGSIVIDLELPDSAAKRLYDLYHTGDSRLSGLMITAIKYLDNDTITSNNFIHLSYTPDLTEEGIAFALRSLAYIYENKDKSPYGLLRRLVANAAVAAAFRRYLSQEGISFEVKASTAFTDHENFDVVLDGRRCNIKSFLISQRDQIFSIRRDPSILLNAGALVPSDSHTIDDHSYNGIYIFAFMTGLVAASQAELQKVIVKEQPYFLVHIMPTTWGNPIYWKPLGTVILESASDKDLIVEVYGQDESRKLKRSVVSISSQGTVTVPETFYSITALHSPHIPDGNLKVRFETMGDNHIIKSSDWSNIWVYGMDIFMVGYATYEEMSQLATQLQPGTRTFQYEQILEKNLSIPVSKLRPLSNMLDMP